MVKNAIIAQSGGPTSVINSSLAGVIKASKENDSVGKLFGSVNGILGILNDNIVNLSDDFGDDEINRLRYTPSAYLGTCRYKLLDDEEIYEKIFEFFKKKNIGYFLYIGGNDSMDTINKLSIYAEKNEKDVHFIGIPKTIDNDLVLTDHCPGFGSASKFVANSIANLYHDGKSFDTNYIIIVEVMGRNAGWLTASSALAKKSFGKPDLIYLPERPFSIDKFLEDVKKTFEKNKTVIVAVSEGVRDEDGCYIFENGKGDKDMFNHAQLGGVGSLLSNIVKEKLGCKTRFIELNLLQRSFGQLASKVDNDEAFITGYYGLNKVINNTGKMMTINRVESEKYEVKIETVDISLVANKEKTVPDEFINDEGNYVTKDCIKYLEPLIMGDVHITYKNGLPNYIGMEY